MINSLSRFTRTSTAAASLALFMAAALAGQQPSTSASAPRTLQETQANVTVESKSEDPAAVAERDLRAKAMREAAHSYGARSGLLRGSYENQISLKKATSFDASFNFTPLMLIDQQPHEQGGDGRARLIRPPVIVEARDAFNQIDSRMIRVRDATFRIESNVDFVPAPPNWRSYLFRDVGEQSPSLPHASLMPRTEQEREKWKLWVAEGWEAGYQQSKSILRADLARLQRDFEGMIRYHELVDQRVVSLPVVATRNDGVTGNDTTLNVNDVTLKITVIPSFQRDPNKWVTISYDAEPMVDEVSYPAEPKPEPKPRVKRIVKPVKPPETGGAIAHPVVTGGAVPETAETAVPDQSKSGG